MECKFCCRTIQLRLLCSSLTDLVVYLTDRDFPLGGSIAVPEWEFPITIQKADDPRQVMYINSHGNAGRHVWCAGSKWWTTADLALFCTDNCPRGGFSTESSHTANSTIRARVFEEGFYSGLGPNFRKCLHNDVGDDRVKGVPCDRFSNEQEMRFECDGDVRGCVIYNQESNQAITLADDGETIVWSDRITSNLQQRWIVRRDTRVNDDYVGFESLQLRGKCLSYATSGRGEVHLVGCSDPTNQSPEIHPFIAGDAIVTPPPPAATRPPSVRLFRNDGNILPIGFEAGEVEDEFIPATFFGVLQGIEYCSGGISLEDQEGNVLFVDIDTTNNFAQPQECKYIFLTPEQKATAFLFQFMALDEPGIFETDTTSAVLMENAVGDALSIKDDRLDFTSLGDFNFEDAPIIRARFCGSRGGAFFILGGLEFQLSEDGCEFLPVDMAQSLSAGGSWFAYRRHPRSFYRKRKLRGSK